MSTYVCATLLVLSVTVVRGVYPKMPFNPLTGFFGMWLFNLLVYEIDGYVQAFSVRLSEFSDIVLALSFLCFVVGSVAGSAYAGVPRRSCGWRSGT